MQDFHFFSGPGPHWLGGFRVCDVEQTADGALRSIDDDHEGSSYRLTPKWSR